MLCVTRAEDRLGSANLGTCDPAVPELRNGREGRRLRAIIGLKRKAGPVVKAPAQGSGVPCSGTGSLADLGN